MAPFGCHDWGIDNPDLGLFGRQLPAGNPVAALTVHWTVIHYRDCASLTPYKGSLGRRKRQLDKLEFAKEVKEFALC